MNTAKLVDVVGKWLHPLRPVLDPDGHTDWQRLITLARTLDRTADKQQLGPELPPGPQRSNRLLDG